MWTLFQRAATHNSALLHRLHQCAKSPGSIQRQPQAVITANFPRVNIWSTAIFHTAQNVCVRKPIARNGSVFGDRLALHSERAPGELLWNHAYSTEQLRS